MSDASVDVGVFDLHAHVVLAGAFGTAGRYGPEHADTADGVEFFRIGDYTMFVRGVTNDGRGPAPDERLHRFGLDLIVGYTYEETLAAAAFVLGGVFDRHPELDVCITHGGGAIVFLAQRFDSMAAFRGRESDFAGSLCRLWFDAHLEPGPARDLVAATVGVDRMVYGTNFGGWDTPTSTDDFDRSLTRNAERLLRLAG